MGKMLLMAAAATMALSLTGCAPDLVAAANDSPAEGSVDPPEEPGKYGSNPRLERLYDRCENGKINACETLFYESPVGSEYEEFAQDRYLALMVERDAEEYEAPAPQPEPAVPQTATWSCYYSPTYNYDWHDDVVCSNGVEQHRPYLREWDDFVTEDEIMQSAREYEQALNSH